MRGAIFSILEARGAYFTRVLDLFAGTGALGIEAISRGAEWCDFVERDRVVASVTSSNLERTGLIAYGKVHVMALPGILAKLSGPYGLIFLDPPYDSDAGQAVLAELARGSLLDAETTIVYEHSRRTMPPEACGALSRTLTRSHGTTSVTLYEAAEDATAT